MLRFHAFAVPAALRPVLACWYVASSDGPHRLVPDACIDLVAVDDGSLWLCGPEKLGWDIDLPCGLEATGVRFRPGAAPAVLGVAASRLVNRRWRLGDVLGGSAVERLIPAARRSLTDGRASSSVLMDFVSEEVCAISDRGRQELNFADNVIGALAARPCANAAQLAESLGMNVRALLRRSNSSFGYGTSVLARLLRLQRFLAISSATSGCLEPESGLAARAINAGYSDQAHLTRECRAISGMTPRQLLGNYVPSFPDMSDPFNTTQRFDVSMVA